MNRTMNLALLREIHKSRIESIRRNYSELYQKKKEEVEYLFDNDDRIKKLQDELNRKKEECQTIETQVEERKKKICKGQCIPEAAWKYEEQLALEENNRYEKELSRLMKERAGGE